MFQKLIISKEEKNFLNLKIQYQSSNLFFSVFLQASWYLMNDQYKDGCLFVRLTRITFD